MGEFTDHSGIDPRKERVPGCTATAGRTCVQVVFRKQETDATTVSPGSCRSSFAGAAS